MSTYETHARGNLTGPPPDPTSPDWGVDRLERLRSNLAGLQGRIDSAARRAGRDPSTVLLLPITKYVDYRAIRALASLGVREFGENRVQDGLEKMRLAAVTGARWQMVGHLQTNKVRKCLSGFQTIHSVDSERLARSISEAAASLGLTVDIFLEVNVSGEGSKNGLRPEGVTPLLGAIQHLPGIRPVGLMTMAPISRDPEASRPLFRELSRLRVDASRRNGLPLGGLSMGMSQDFETAIEEGATVVRIGSAIFEGLI